MDTASERATERAIFIEYHHGRPFSVTTVTDDGRGGNEYAVEYCKRDHCLYYHDAGSGPGHVIKSPGVITYWAAPGHAVETDPKSRRLTRALWKTRLEKAINHGGSIRIGGTAGIYEGRCEYCRVCEDFLPVEDVDYNNPCDHIWWCELSREYSRPGGRCRWDCARCRSEGRETNPAPPLMLVARGYGIAASLAGGLAAVARDLLASRDLTPDRFRRLMGWCSQEGTAAVAMALRGEVHPDANAAILDDVSGRLRLDAAGRKRLFEAFEIEEGKGR